MTSINNISGGLTDSYITSGFVRNPIVAGMVVSFITILILYISKSEDLTKLFIMATLANTVYLFFHAHCITNNVGKHASSDNLVQEFKNIQTNIDTKDQFAPPSDE